MNFNPKVTVIPATKPKAVKKVGIYCRVSTNHIDQLKSLTAQASFLTKMVSHVPKWRLSDIYIDICSGKEKTKRPEFNRMLDDCKKHEIDIIITKNVSRFGRDSVEVLESLNLLTELGVRILFEQENIDTNDIESRMLVSLVEAYVQAENESRSENIRWGIKQKAANGTLKLYQRKCYGYQNDNDGNLVIDEKETENVRLIFQLYLNGLSVLSIIETLKMRNIKSPRGKDTWCKHTIEEILSNEKYTGDVKALKKSESGTYLIEHHHPPIISYETFEKTKKEKKKRSNIEETEEGKKRKKTKYSSKKK